MLTSHGLAYEEIHTYGLPFWKPASVFAHYVRIVIVFAIGKINILLLLHSRRKFEKLECNLVR